MTDPVWITGEDCRSAHEKLLRHFGGLPGLRDEGLLASALGRPRQAFAYGTNDLFALASLYAHGIVKNHPFVDGNKRTGFVMAALFLQCNGWRLVAPEEQAVLRTLALAAGDIGEADFAAWLEASCEKRA